MRRTLALVFLLFLFAGSSAFAQEEPAHPPQKGVTLTLSHAPLDSLVRRIEANLPVRFFYDATQFDSLDVDLSVKDIPLDQLLDQLFRNTPYHYAIDEDGNVFLTKGWMIQTGLAPTITNQSDSAARTSVRFG